MTVRDQIDALEEQIEALQRDQERVIAEADPTFEHLPERMARLRGNERYVIVYADGSFPRYNIPLTQRPAALRAARRSGRYIWDTRENVVFDGEENILLRRTS